MKILFATSEMTPLVKTGGLADVSGALPRALAALGHEVAVVMPFYGSIDRRGLSARKVLSEIRVDLPAGRRTLNVWKASSPLQTPDSGLQTPTVYLIEDDGLFNRPELYAIAGREYPDNPLRFSYFSLAAWWMLKGLDWTPDVIHCNDWQTAMIPIYRRYLGAVGGDPELAAVRILLTIHNISFQGHYASTLVGLLGLPEGAYHPEGVEFHGGLNLLKGAVMTSDWITTVSPQYAREIQTPEFGCGLDGVLASRSNRLTGILNGIDTDVWNPATDPALTANYSLTDMKGKAICKRALQERFGLPVEARTPLLAIISRLADQKGLDLVAEIMPALLKRKVQFVLLGTGQPEYHKLFGNLARQHPRQAGVELGFDDALAHQIEAGADVFLMPSHFEPCGLNQLYSLRYGTAPVVRRTGGLADSIVDATKETVASGEGTGFVFDDYEAEALDETIDRALDLYRDAPQTWTKLIQNGMAQDFSWAHSAQEYEKLYNVF